MNPPKNPNEQQARAAMREAIAPMLVNPPADDAALLTRAAATWPDLGRYLSDMRLGVGLAFDRDRGVMVPRMTVVIEAKGENPK